jgi:hypothetical protein
MAKPERAATTVARTIATKVERSLIPAARVIAASMKPPLTAYSTQRSLLRRLFKSLS